MSTYTGASAGDNQVAFRGYLLSHSIDDKQQVCNQGLRVKKVNIEECNNVTT